MNFITCFFNFSTQLYPICLQFVCGLSLCCGSQANLSRNEIQKVVDHYKTDDGRVCYQDFCDMMENGKDTNCNLIPLSYTWFCVHLYTNSMDNLISFSAFTLRDLEKMPTAEPYRPPVGALAKVTHQKKLAINTQKNIQAKSIRITYFSLTLSI